MITSVLDIYVQQDKMTKLDGMHGHDAPLPEIASPILIGILVVYTIFQIVGKKIF